MKETFLADTYALIEIIKGNSSYKPYLQTNLLTTQYALIELYYYILRRYDEHEANKQLIVHQQILTPITLFTIQQAMLFKHEHKQEKLSYTDCIGYALAKEINIPFLTSDNQFKDKENVEFVQ